MAHIIEMPNPGAPGVSYYTPAQDPPSGAALDPQPHGKPLPLLFKPLKIRNLELHNRVFLAPLCQYSSEDGFPSPWHMSHLGGILTRGPGLTFVEATAVLPEGRITPQDAGIWDDRHVEGWAKIVEFAHSQNQKIAIQLAHAGRKASTVAPWLHFGMTSTKNVGGWPDEVYGPSDEPWDEFHAVPKALTKEGIKRIVRAWTDATKRALQAGFDMIEIHSAHGFLLHSFCSPAVNKRTDEYGGTFENRIRLMLEVVDGMRAVMPPDMPLFLRISASDWLEESMPDSPSWRVEDTIRLSRILADHGVDAIDISWAGNHRAQRFKSHSVQPVLAGEIHEAVQGVQVKGGGNLLVAGAGGIRDGHTAERLLQEGRCDVVLVGRQFQRDPGAVWGMAEDLDVSIYLAKQIGWGFGGRGSSTSRRLKPKVAEEETGKE